MSDLPGAFLAKAEESLAGHDFVQAEFIGQLINRRKLYPSTLRDTLERALTLRQIADYRAEQVSEAQADRVLRRTRVFVEIVAKEGKLK